jgi:uncharacterized protein YbjT (DUF2867 family)
MDVTTTSGAGTVLVIGGLGRTGALTVDLLRRQGRPVRILSRSADPSAEVVRGSVDDPDAVRKALAGVTGVVIVVEADTDADARRVHAEGTRTVVRLARTGTHVVLVSQIYLTRAAEHPQLAEVIAARQEAEAAVRASMLSYTIVRPGWLVDSPAPGGVRLEQGDTGDGTVSRVNVARVCAAALRTPAAAGRTFEVFDDPHAPVDDDWAVRFGALTFDEHTPGRPGSR